MTNIRLYLSSVYWFKMFNALPSLLNKIYFFIFLFILVCFIYFMILDFLSFIFSIRLCGTISSSTSDNSKCGFYSTLTSSLRYRFSYWIIIINYCIFEQELILAFLWISAITINIKSNYLLILLLSILFIEVILVKFGDILSLCNLVSNI